MPGNREVCFIVMPFGKTTDEHTEDYWTKHFDSFLKPLIEENTALKARRSKALRGDLLREIITALAVSRLVVADLTDLNPNVYWELGVRQSFLSIPQSRLFSLQPPRQEALTLPQPQGWPSNSCYLRHDFPLLT